MTPDVHVPLHTVQTRTALSNPRTVLRRIAALCAALSFALILTPSRSQAQLGFGGVVYDPRNFAQAVLLYKRAYDQLTVARNQLEAQATALRKLSHPTWREVGPLMNQIDVVARQGASLGYSLSGVDAEFAHTFPGTVAYGDYQAQQALAGTQTARTLATMRGVLNAASRTAQTFGDGIDRLRVMKQQMATIRGHQAALELANTMAAYSAEELTLLRQQLATLTNAQAVYYANQVDREAQRAANEGAVWSWLATAPAPARTISFRPDGQ